MIDSVCCALIVSKVLCILQLKSQIDQVRIGKVLRLKQGNRLTHWQTIIHQGPQTDIDKTTDVDEVAFSKLQIGQNDLKEEMIEVTDALVQSPLTETSRDMTGKNDGKELSEAERKFQQEEEKYDLYQGIHVGQLSEEEEESDTESDSSTYSYFT